MGTHDGHRERLRQRYRKDGMDGFADHEILELLLFYAIPRRDTNPIAHALIDHFGDLASVLEAPPEELEKVKGMNGSAAVLLSLLPAVARRHMSERTNLGRELDTFTKCGEYLLPRFFGLREEAVYLLCLDAKLAVLNCRMLFRGSVNSAAVSVRKIAEIALACGASSVVLAHNHTSGIAVPSREDEETTARVRVALEALDIKLLDHIIVANDDFVSMAESHIGF